MHVGKSSWNILVGIAGLALFWCGGMCEAQPLIANQPVAQAYQGHKLLKVRVQSQREFDALSASGARIWDCVTGIGSLTCSVSPQAFEQLKKTSIKFQIVNDDIGPLVQSDIARMQAQLNPPDQVPGGIAGGASNWFADFKTYQQVNAYIDSLIALRPDLVSKIVVGTTIEGRTIWAMRISGPTGSNKPAIMYSGCQHAREWIAVMVPMYIADMLVRRYESDASIKSLVDQLEFFIVPIINPDGYEYTYAAGGDRLWRKNRRNNGGGSFGVDLNRNWSVNWNGGNSTSTNPNDEVFVGASAFSEPETQAVRDFIQARPQLRAHIDFHSFSQLILQNWHYSNALTDNADVEDLIGTEMNREIFATHSVNYFNGWAGPLLYLASGVFPDWCYGVRGFMGYTIELRDVGQTGFMLPADQIMPTCEEALSAALKLAQWVTRGAAFTFPRALPATVITGAASSITAKIQPVAGAALQPGSAQLFTRISPGSAFAATSLVPNGTSFLGTLPSALCGRTIQYYFRVQTTTGQVVTSPADAPQSFYQSTAVNPALSFDFESNAGWTTQNLNAFTGMWERGVPIDDPNWPYDPPVDADGSGQCFVTQNQVGQTGVWNGIVRLISPIVDLASIAANGRAVISYSYFLHLSTPGGNDALIVEFSSNGNAGPWVEVVRHTASGESSWRSYAITQSQLESLGIALTANMQMRFSLSDGAPQSVVEAGVDAVRIANDCGGPPVCIGDIAPPNGNGYGNGVVNVDDLLLVITSWGQCPALPNPCVADIAPPGGNHVVNVDDLLSVINHWGNCP